MSRIGKKAVELPKGVTVNVQDGMVVVKCGKNEISRPLVATTGIEVEGNTARVVRVQDETAARLQKKSFELVTVCNEPCFKIW